MEEAQPVSSPSDSPSLCPAGNAAQWSRMHWCSVAVRINRLYGALQRQEKKHTQTITNVANGILGCVKLNAFSPVVYDMRGLQIVFYAINDKRVHKRKHTRGWVESCMSWSLATVSGTACNPFPQIHTKPSIQSQCKIARVTSMGEAFSKEDPLWRGVNGNVHHTGLCTATGQLCKRIPLLSKCRINHIWILLRMEIKRVTYH